MADEELHETTADTQEDWQSEAAESTEETTDNDAVAESAEDDDDLDIPMDCVEAVLNRHRRQGLTDPSDAAHDESSG